MSWVTISLEVNTKKGLYADFGAELEKPRSGILLEMSPMNCGCEHDVDEDEDFGGDTLAISPNAENRESPFES